MLSRKATALRRGRQRGLSIVELMVGVAVGLFIVAGAATLVATQLSDNQRLLYDTQVQQDLRATADIMARELRRGSYWNLSQNTVWNASAGGNAQPNPYWTNLSVSANQVIYNYRRPDNTAGAFGYRLSGGTIQTNLGSLVSWQDLTDKNVVTITNFVPVLTSSPPVQLPCEKPCPLPIPPGGSATYCWPTVALHTIKLTITGHPANDSSAAATRTVESVVRLRNDQVTFNARTSSGTALACPT